MKKKEVKKPKSGAPLLIIGGVVVAALVAVFYYYSSSNAPSNSANRANTANANGQRTPQSASTSTLGAVPPNMIGSSTASVTVEEFADFQCAACASVHPVLKELQSIYGNRIRFVFRNFPLMIPQHDKAYEAAIAVEAAGMQDKAKFWELQNLLFVNQQVWSNNPNYRQLWEGYVQQIGLDVERFKADMAGQTARGRVNDDMARGRSLSVNSTPTLYVNGKNIPMESITVANLRQVVDSEIQNAMKTQPASSGPAPANSANKTGSAANAK
ncbi:MAG TPA: thioredoxin domain-containing protein [Pyrinomonadaceae bacterium]|nr:thioredoxin domain-containing protein [Pyrinomonadaceae bacterium]